MKPTTGIRRITCCTGLTPTRPFKSTCLRGKSIFPWPINQAKMTG